MYSHSCVCVCVCVRVAEPFEPLTLSDTTLIVSLNCRDEKDGRLLIFTP